MSALRRVAVLGSVLALAAPASAIGSTSTSFEASPCVPPAVTTQSDKNSGAIDYGAHPRLSANGQLRAIMLFVDFPDAPATESTSALYDALVPPARAWFAAASYGRMSLEVTPVPTWLRMPRPSTSYVTRANLSCALERELLQAALDAADASTDFAGYRLLYVVASYPSGIDYSPASRRSARSSA